MPSAVPRRRTVGVTLSILVAFLSTDVAHPQSRIEATPEAQPATRTLSVVGTTDLHGRIFPEHGHGVALLGGYLRNLRAARVRDGGDVLLVDAGDTFESGIVSNLSEGRIVVDAYNTLGYDALAIGNHEFDYGAVDGARARAEPDMRGALKVAAARARFPFLAANLVDATTSRLVTWPNVAPSTLVEKAGIRVGLIGIMTRDALRHTLAAHVQGLATTPLASSVEREARRLRRDGAEVVVVVAHAGGWCGRFDDPDDLSSCDHDAEIFQLARQLPHELVDVIVGGHTHAAVAHRVAGIPIVQAHPRGAAFSRVDLTVTADAGVVSARIFPPQSICAAAEGRCARDDVRYEGAPVQPDATITAAMQPELDRVRRWRSESLGVVLDAPLVRQTQGLGSPLGNLFADAVRAVSPDAEVGLGLGARRGGLRADLPAGPLTRGAVYDAFPFDNRVVTLRLTGAQLREVLTRAVARRGRGLPGVSGIRVQVRCENDRASIAVVRASGRPIDANETLVLATTDRYARRFASQAGPGAVLPSAPLIREAAATWLSARGQLRSEDLDGPPRWEPVDGGACLAAN